MSARVTITEFLLERIDDDEWQAEMSLGNRLPQDVDDEVWSESVARRVLAECAAKRAILADRKRIDRSANDDEWSMGYSDANYSAICALAAIHKDHPDYRQEWAVA